MRLARSTLLLTLATSLSSVLACERDEARPVVVGPAPDSFHVSITTSKGDVRVAVYKAWSPHGADRFYRLVSEGFFDDQRFFRVNQARGRTCSGTGRIAGGAGALHWCAQSAQRNVSTSGLCGITRRPFADPHAGQMWGKITIADHETENPAPPDPMQVLIVRTRRSGLTGLRSTHAASSCWWSPG